MPKGTPLTEEELAKRRHEIFHQVVHVFLEKGFQETSMRAQDTTLHPLLGMMLQGSSKRSTAAWSAEILPLRSGVT